MLIRSKFESNLPSEDELREYAKYKGELAEESRAEAARAAGDLEATEERKSYQSALEHKNAKSLEYWKQMEKLVDEPVENWITRAKVKTIPLDGFRAHAVRAKKLARSLSNPNTSSLAEAYWDKVIQRIDAPLDESLLGEQQRFIWERGPTQTELDKQQGTIEAMEYRRNELKARYEVLKNIDARTPDEIAGGEPPHPPWAKMYQMEQEIKTLNEEISIQKKILRDDSLQKARYESSK
jgi:hypothetical protein